MMAEFGLPERARERPECTGFIGFMLGHRYPERWSYAREVFEQALYCTRCGMVAEGVRPTREEEK